MTDELEAQAEELLDLVDLGIHGLTGFGGDQVGGLLVLSRQLRLLLGLIELQALSLELRCQGPGERPRRGRNRAGQPGVDEKTPGGQLLAVARRDEALLGRVREDVGGVPDLGDQIFQ